MKHTKYILALIGIVLLGMVAFFFKEPAEEPVERSEEFRYKAKTRKGMEKRIVRGKKSSRIAVHTVTKERVKPTFELDDAEEAALSAEQKALLEAIRKALADDNKDEVLRLVQKLQASKEWPDGIPKTIKLAAIEAVGWFGVSCLPEIVGFLADSNPEVVEAAIEKFEESLSDMDISDRERSQILIAAAKVISDAEVMDQFLFELNDMRNSVAVETIKAIMASGTAASKSALVDNIEFFTGEEGLDTPEKLDQWLKDNPDGEDDEEFYGGSKEE